MLSNYGTFKNNHLFPGFSNREKGIAFKCYGGDLEHNMEWKKAFI